MRQAVTVNAKRSASRRAGFLTDEHPLAPGETVLILEEAPDLVLRASDKAGVLDDTAASLLQLDVPFGADDPTWEAMQRSGFELEEDFPF